MRGGFVLFKQLKRTGLVCALIIVCLSFLCVGVGADDFEYVEISSGQTLSCQASCDEEAFLKFVPLVSGKYRFYSIGEYDTVCSLFDESFSLLTSDDDEGNMSNFCVEYDFVEGETYYFSVSLFSYKNLLSVCVCLETISVSDEHIHSYTLLTQTKPTCTSEGENIYSCFCGHKYSEVLEELGHTLVYTTEIVPTCTGGGSVFVSCKNCNYSYHSAASPLGHSFNSFYTTDKAATCTAQGSMSIHCKRCNAKTQSIKTEKLGHAYSSSFTVDQKATTENAGSKSQHCSRCKAKTQVTTIRKITSVKLSKTTFVYDKKQHKPSVLVSDSSGKALKNGTDYTVAFSKSSTKIGTYSVTVKFKGNYSGKITLKYKIVPKQVSSLKATQTKTSVTLSWNKTAGAQKYRIYKYNSKKKTYSLLKTTEKTSCKISKLKSGTDYIFAVKALCVKDEKNYFSENANIIETATKPDEITLSVKAKNKKAVLSWKKTACSGYIIYMYSNDSGEYRQIKKIDESKTQSYTKTNLAKGKKYYFKVKTYKKVGGKTLYSAYSNAVKMTA